MATGTVAGAVAVVSIAAASKECEARGDWRIVGAVAGIVSVAGSIAVTVIVIGGSAVVADTGISRCRITHTCDGVAVRVNHTRGKREAARSGKGEKAEGCFHDRVMDLIRAKGIHIIPHGSLERTPRLSQW